MRAINHALTGAVIGLTIDNPALAMLAAFASHFVCDMIPHHGFKINNEAKQRSVLAGNFFKYTLYADATLCFLVVAILVVTKPHNWLSACICAFLAASPDFLSISIYRDAKANKMPSRNALQRFLSKIQWFERPSGAIVEVAWFLGFSFLLFQLIK